MSGKHNFEFKLRSVMMYNHTLFISYGKQKYKVHAEDSPSSKTGLIVEFSKLELEEKFFEKMIAAFQEWAQEQKLQNTII